MSMVHELGRAEDNFFLKREEGNNFNLKKNIE